MGPWQADFPNRLSLSLTFGLTLKHEKLLITH